MIKVDVIAVLIAGIASMGLGTLWYSKVLFGNKWAELSGAKLPETTEEKKRMFRKMPLSLLSELVIAYVIGYLIALTGSYSLATMFSLILWIWLGFAATLLMGSFLWEGKSPLLYFINVSYRLLSWLVIGWVIIYLPFF